MRINLYATVFLREGSGAAHGNRGRRSRPRRSKEFDPSSRLVDYAMTKAALVAFTKALAEELARGIRVNSVAPGPIWTPLIPATGWPDKLPKFGQDTPLGRRQPAELAGAYVYLASDDASYTSGAILPVTGGKPL